MIRPISVCQNCVDFIGLDIPNAVSAFLTRLYDAIVIRESGLTIIELELDDDDVRWLPSPVTCVCNHNTILRCELMYISSVINCSACKRTFITSFLRLRTYNS